MNFGQFAKMLYIAATSVLGLSVVSASGDATGATDFSALTAAVAAAALGIKVRIRKGNYIVSQALQISVGANLFIDAGTVIKLRDGVTVTGCSWSSSVSPTHVTVSSNTGIVIGMYVLDGAGNLAVGTPFGNIAFGTKVTNINGTDITLSIANTGTTASGGTLNFYQNDNVMQVAANINNWSLTCPEGWFTLDANSQWYYPYPVNQQDSTGNGLQISSCSDFTIDGLDAYNAFFHGVIAVGQLSGAKVKRIRGRANGYRSVHMHSQAINGNATPQLRDNWFGLIESIGNGWGAFHARYQGSEYNSGIFVVYSNVLNTQIDTIRCKGDVRNACSLTGGAGSFIPGFESKRVQIDKIIIENCGYGISFNNSMMKVWVGSGMARGDQVYFSTSFDTIDAASTTTYYVSDDGSVNSVKTRRINMPAGTIAANGMAMGQRLVMSGGTTGMQYDGAIIWSVNPGGGAAGKDQVAVFYEPNPANDPYTTVASNTWCEWWGAAEYSMSFNSPTTTQIRDIKFGSWDSDGFATGAVACSAILTTEYNYKGIDFGHMTVNKGFNALNIGGMQNFSWGSYRESNTGTFTPHLAASGGANSYLKSCANFEMRNFSYEQTLGVANNNIRLQMDANCRNGTVYATGLLKPTGVVTLKCLTPSGAGANSAGSQGPITLVNPVASDGTPLTVAGTMISRVDATACIVTRPVDAP